MDENILISVIVPVYKVEEYLDRCVQSLLRQTYRNLEIILVDDGSPDNCGALCDGYASQDARVKVIHKKNGGLSSARNAGIDVARGDYIVFVDSDDWVEADTYEAMLQMAIRENVKLVCAGRYDVESASGERTVGLCPVRREVISAQELTRRMFTWDHIDCAAWDKLYHHSVFGDVRYPDGKVHEDIPTTYRLAMNAGRIAMLDKPVYNYFHRPGSITTDSLSERSFHFPEHTAGILEDIRKNYPELLDAATYLRIRALGYGVQIIDIAGKGARARFPEKYRSMRHDLGRMLGKAMRNPYAGRKEKLSWILLVMGIYGPVLRTYMAIRYGKRI